MTAQDYPVTFGYGATDGHFYGPKGTIGPYHRGDDRSMPDGTPVLVNGTQIGLSGHAGNVSGPHLHIGKFVNDKDVNPNGGGFQLTGATVVNTGSDPTNGNFVKVQDSTGAIWVYLHLSQINVKQGQQLGDNVLITQPIAELLTMLTTGWPTPTQDGGDFVKSLVGQDVDEAGLKHMLENMLNTPQRRDLINAVNAPRTATPKQLAAEKAIDALKEAQKL